MARLSRNEKKNVTRLMIIEATMDIISEQGINNFSVDDVSNRAGFSKGAFYAHFSSKEHLMGQYAQKILEPTADNAKLETDSISWLTNIASDQHKNRKNRILQIELLVRSFRNKTGEEVLLSSYSQWISTMAQTYKMINGKNLSKQEEEILAEIGICFGHGYSLLSYAGIKLHPIEEILPRFLGMIANFDEDIQPGAHQP
jgi:AcrR family transcriptional regulator